MRKLAFVGLAVSIFATLGAAYATAKTFVYVSMADDGEVDAYAMDEGSGALSPLGKTKAGKMVMPMAVSPDKKHLYAVVRSQPFTVITYAIDPAGGALTQKATAPLPDSMAYASTDATGRFLLTASYPGHTVAVSAINAQGLADSEAVQVLPTGKHAHAILTERSNRFAYATSLGEDQIHQFLFDAGTGKLTPSDPPLAKMKAGSGARHLVFSQDGKNLYVLGELTGVICQFAVDQTKGTLTEADCVGTVPADAGLIPGVLPPPPPQTGTPAPPADTRPKVWAADIQITPDGKFIYATERTSSKIALLSVAQGTGKLTYVTNYATETQPRGIRVDGKGAFLIASGQKSDQLSVYKINPADGSLASVGRYPVGKGANWVEIVELP
jgi:6-phosphogluconolactonase